MYTDQSEFPPVGKLWFTVNDMPRIRYEDDGMWRRIIAIPFNVSFQGKNRDRDLDDKLLVELPGILNWALEGARKYSELGKLGRPKASLDLTRSLRRAEDTVGLWIESRCETVSFGKVQSAVAYQDYSEAVKQEKLTPLPQKEFKADLVRRGYPHRPGNRFNYFAGLKLMPIPKPEIE
jgi:putative DNA primase/helicase